MDCPSEENMIRMKLDGYAYIRKLNFNIPERLLEVFHQGNLKELEGLLEELQLGSRLLSNEKVAESQGLADAASESKQKQLLWTVLAINFAFFLIESIAGLLANSMGLVADSLDMLADALVYGLSLYAVGHAVARKKKVAKMSGYFQMVLALIGFGEVIRRFSGFEATPDFMTMVVVSFLALIANGLCLYLLQRSKDEEAHMQASMIFTSNDVIINTGVILAGLLVYFTDSLLPDLIIGLLVFLIVIRGAFRILRLAN